MTWEPELEELRRRHQMRRIPQVVLDNGSVFELGRAYGRPTITCLA